MVKDTNMEKVDSLKNKNKSMNILLVYPKYAKTFWNETATYSSFLKISFRLWQFRCSERNKNKFIEFFFILCLSLKRLKFIEFLVFTLSKTDQPGYIKECYKDGLFQLLKFLLVMCVRGLCNETQKIGFYLSQFFPVRQVDSEVDKFLHGRTLVDDPGNVESRLVQGQPLQLFRIWK